MAENAITSVGTVVHLVAAAPTALTAAAWEAVTGWVEIGDLDTVGEFGPEDNVIERTPLKTGNVTKGKGSTNYGDMSLDGAFVADDPGQIMLQAARKAKTNYSFRITYQDGSMEYLRGLVTAFRKNPGGAEDFLNFMSSVSISDEPIFVTADA